jgi:hypothetical protein
MVVNRQDILEIFGEAAERAAVRVWLDPALLGQSQRVGRDAHAPRGRRRVPPPVRSDGAAYVVERPAYGSKNGWLVRIHLPPMSGERVRGCACGGWLERRAGMVQLMHVGKPGCREKRSA